MTRTCLRIAAQHNVDLRLSPHGVNIPHQRENQQRGGENKMRANNCSNDKTMAMAGRGVVKHQSGMALTAIGGDNIAAWPRGAIARRGPQTACAA